MSGLGGPETEHPPAVSRIAFTDLITRQSCELVVPQNGRVYATKDEPKIGVAHPRCDALADLAVDLDAFYCPDCEWSGRVSGAWAIDMIENAIGGGGG